MDPIRLPSLRDLVDMPPATHSTHQQPRATTRLWTAINHPPENSASVSPPAQTGNHLPKPNLSPSSRFQEETWNHRREAAAAIPSPIQSVEPKPGQSPIHGGLPPSSSGHHPTAGQPITGERQDSAVFTSAPGQTTTATVRPADASSQLLDSPERHHSGNPKHRSAPSHPTTPPSDQAHTVRTPTRATAHDRQWELPSVTSQQGTARRTGSDSTRSAEAPLPQTALFVHEKTKMPPPLVPALAPTTPPEPAAIDHSTYSAPSPHTNVSQSPSGAGKEECAYCGSKWSFPPPDPTAVNVKSSPNPDHMDRIESAMRSFISDYRAKKEADFREWESYHQHCREAKAQPGSKRRTVDLTDDTSLPSKSRKLSSESPPRRSSRSPLPEPPSNTASTNGEHAPASFYFKAKNGLPVQISSPIASMLKLDGAPPPTQYVPLANDSSNMFHDPSGKSKRVSRRGGAPASRRGTLEETAH